MKMKTYYWILAFVFLANTQLVNAQQARKGQHQSGYTGRISYSLGAGLSNYYGDLCHGYGQGGCLRPRVALGGGLYYKFDEMFSIKADLNYYRISANDYHQSRGIRMRAGNMEFYTSLVASFGAHDKNYGHKNEIIPFIFVGIGATYFNPQMKTSDGWVNMKSLNANGETADNLGLIIPVGFGLKLHQSRWTDFLIEFGYRFTSTDFLDGAGRSDIDYSMVSAKAEKYIPSISSKTGGIMGNPESKDGYWIAMIKYKHTPHKSSNKKKRKR